MCTRLVQYATRLDAWLYIIQRRNLGDEQIKTLLFDRLQQDTRYKRIFCDESFIANRNKLAAFMSTVTSEELFDFSAVPALLYDSNGEVSSEIRAGQVWYRKDYCQSCKRIVVSGKRDLQDLYGRTELKDHECTNVPIISAAAEEE